MTEQEFDVLVNETIPQQLFHVMRTDVDDKTGALLDEVILIEAISSDISCLKHKPLQWFVDNFIHSEDNPNIIKIFNKDDFEYENVLFSNNPKDCLSELFPINDDDNAVEISEEELFHKILSDERE